MNLFVVALTLMVSVPSIPAAQIKQDGSVMSRRVDSAMQLLLKKTLEHRFKSNFYVFIDDREVKIHVYSDLSDRDLSIVETICHCALGKSKTLRIEKKSGLSPRESP